MLKRILAGLGVVVALLIIALSFVQHRDLFLGSGSQPVTAGGMTRTASASETLLDQFDTTNLQIPQAEIRRGGPPKDGIPAITDPDVVAAGEVDFLEPGDRVVGITIAGESRAYPIRLLNWHEVVNDALAGVPFAVVYCPLCDSASVFDRRVGDETLEFGISGLLYNSNVLLYDRTHDGLWSQILFKAVSGPHAGHELDHLPWDVATFEEWKDRHPDSTVATFNTGHQRAYDRNPYEQYFQGEGLMFPAKGGDDDRLPQKEPVVGVAYDGFARAYPLEQVAKAEDGRLVDELEGGRIVLEGRDGQSVRVVEKPEGANVVHTFWFAWVAFHPETTIFEDSSE